MRFTAAVTALAFFYSTTQPAFAESTPSTAALVGFRTSGTNLETQFRTYLEEQLRNNKRIRLLPDDVVGRKVEDIWKAQDAEAVPQLEAAKKNYVRGKKLYEQLDVDEAIKALSQAARGYREALPVLKDNRYLLASHLYLGMALVIRGSVPEGREFIRQMIVLDPSREKHLLPPKEFPPKIVQLHKEITQEVLKGPMGTVSITTKPSGASVYFDGVLQGPSPLRLQNVPTGEHFLVAERKGLGRVARRVVVVADENTVDENLEEWEPLMPYPYEKRGNPIANEWLKNLGTSLNASILILGRMNETQPEQPGVFAQLYDVRSGEFSKIENINLDRAKVKKSAEELAKRISNQVTVEGLVVAQINPNAGASGLTPSIALPKTNDSSSSSLTSESRAFYKTWWFWTIVGIALAGTGTYLIAGQGSPDHHVLQISNPLAP